MYNYNHLYYFYITAKHLGVTNAAKHLRISQPSLSSQLKILEENLDVKLFEKVGRRKQLTKGGHIIYGFCRRMFEVADQMDEVLLQRVSSSSRHIHIGVSDQVERSFVVEVVSHFLKKQKLASRPKVTIVAGTQEQLSDRLKFKELDVVITELAVIDPDLMNLNRVETPIMLACSKKWKTNQNFKNKDVISIVNQIADGHYEQWVMPSAKFKLRSEIQRFFEQNEMKGRIVFESDVVASLVQSVVDDVGIGFFPLFYIANEIKQKKLQVFGPLNGYWTYQISLVCNSHSHSDSLIQLFADSFKAVSQVK